MRAAPKRWWAVPLVPLYAGVVWAKDAARARGWLAVKRLGWPVVSVGSLSAGGAGKTPVVMSLAALLARHGVAVDVLSRGYGRGSGAVERVPLDGSARAFGDEPMEMARAGLEVFVGAERYEAGLLAEQAFAAGMKERRVHLLDDGFQHRRLERALDVVLLTLADVRDWMLPAGNLREPLGAMGRADVVVVREEEADALEAWRRYFPKAKVWVMRRELRVPADAAKKPLVFCGIARPEDFLRMLREAGVEIAGKRVWPDHHAYAEEDIELLIELAERAGADGFLLTAKDVVKISVSNRKRLETLGPVGVVGLEVVFQDEGLVVADLLSCFLKLRMEID